MSRQANVIDPSALSDDERNAIEAEIARQQAAFDAWRKKNPKADPTTYEGFEALETLKDQINPNRYTVAAGVRAEFADAVRSAAKRAGYTVSTWLRYHIERKLGNDPALPVTDANTETITIGTALHRTVKAALQTALGEEQTQADYIRQVAADAAGYTLTEEDKPAPAGEALRKRVQQMAVKDQILMDLWADDPSIVARTLARRGKTWTEAGFKPDMVQAALEAGTLTQEEYEAVAGTGMVPEPVATNA